MTPPDPSPPGSPAVILASGSRYRRALLERILPTFDVVVNPIDESPRPNEAPAALSDRLARAKANAVAQRHPGGVVIGSDQVAALGGLIMGKPGTTKRAVAQLLACSSQEMVLHTAVCVLGPGQLVSTHRDDTRLTFRTLSQDEISRYVEREQPLDCAGSFKIEGLGIALFSAVQTADPTAIQGLPLIWLAACLERHGVAVL